MGTFRITGGKKLSGIIKPQGAKNEALQVLCSVLLTDDVVRINNIPDILDVQKLIIILKELGVKVKRHDSNSYSFKADEINLKYLHTNKFKDNSGSLRGSIMIVGPLLAR
jgi:UDP-N-acetylglucosamine 1-carboxyvinyltransferase